MTNSRRWVLTATSSLAAALLLSLPAQANKAPMTNSAADEALYGDDPDHPIPYLNKLDVFAEMKTGGGDLHIVISTPLADDRRSLERLLQKIGNYLSFINSDEFKKECGQPTPENTHIIVDIDPGSSAAAFDLLERSKPWTLQNHTTLLVKKLDRK